MEIKNSLINTKKYKASIKLNKKFANKAKKAQSKNFKNCSEFEKILYRPNDKSDRVTKNENGKFLKLNKHITLLYLFSKSETDNICNKIRKMLYENPMNQNIFSTIVDNKFNDTFSHYNNYNNFGSFGHIGHIQPKSISKNVNFIDMTIFNFSYNYFGIAFNCSINQNILNEINELIDCDIDNTIEFREYFIGNKKYIGRYDWNPDIIRSDILSNNIIELKCIINDFLNMLIEKVKFRY